MGNCRPIQVHFLLTYSCNFECDHCFVYSSPRADGTFTIGKLKAALDDIAKAGSVEWIYFEGGEPFLFYPLMLEGLRLAHEMGFKTGIVTNAYWAVSREDAELWLRPLRALELSDLSVSDDSYHYGDEKETPPKNARAAAEKLGLPAGSICIEKPEIATVNSGHRGKPVLGGGPLLKGRAVENLEEGLPRRDFEEFTECPEEDLRNPVRVHIDPYGNVHLCQGLLMGNMFETPISELFDRYDAESHPICGSLLEGGPALLAKKYNVTHDKKYISACHFCYIVRRSLLDRFPKHLAPPQVYGIE